ncbi:MAG: radical SAM family heme chaperone HemW [Pseudomonadota bacterium]
MALGGGYGFGVYIHWPYCTRICPYCDFNVYAAKNRDNRPLVDAICTDLVRQYESFGASHSLSTIYFGGGTPSLLGEPGLAQILETIHACFGAPRWETTLEANPLDITQEALSSWNRLGITRLSLGVQSLRDEALVFLGRDHTSAQARRAVQDALVMFPSTSVDLIYARPSQSISDWQAELGETLSLGAPHLSLYELTIEERTVFGKKAARGELVPMDDDAQADLYERTQEICEAAGLPAYEISNHARSAAFESSHNRIYWQSGDWIGVGPGAHGRLTQEGKRLATQALRTPAAYIQAAKSNLPQIEVEALSDTDTLREFVAMGLRPREGIDLQRASAMGLAFDPTLLSDLESEGLMTRSADRIALTGSGRLLADHITARLAP